MTTNYMSNYTYGTNAYDEIPEVAKPYGIKKVVFIGGKRALAAAEPKARKALGGSGIEVTGSFVYGVDSTQTNIDRLVATPEVKEADAVFGFGGGKALDTAKMVADELDEVIFSFPTICSNCAAGTAIAVIYHDDGSFDRYGFPKAAKHLFIDTDVIAKAPVEYFWAGIGDALSKQPEVTHVSEGEDLTNTGALGVAIAKTVSEPLFKYGEQGMDDVKNDTPSKAVEEIALDILVSTGYASNLTNQKDFYYNSWHAHAFYNSTTAVKREGTYLHGQIVSFGVLVLFAYFHEEEEFKKYQEFNKRIGLPVTLGELGLSQDDVEEITKGAMETNEYRNRPFDPEKFSEAIRRADELGKQLLEK